MPREQLRNHSLQHIAIRLEFKDLQDGRLYVSSPDLPRFNVAIGADEELIDALQGPLRLFLSQYLGGMEIHEIASAMEPVSYRAQAVGIPLSDHRKPDLLLAAVA